MVEDTNHLVRASLLLFDTFFLVEMPLEIVLACKFFATEVAWI